MIDFNIVHRAKQNDDQSILNIIESTKPLCISMLKKLYMTENLEDLLSELSILTINSIQKFNSNCITIPDKLIKLIEKIDLLHIYSPKSINPFLIDKIEKITKTKRVYELNSQYEKTREDSISN